MSPIPASSPIGGPLWTWVVPVLLFAVALFATLALYRRFSTQPAGDDGAGG
jgi:hypothetical protein